MARSEYDITDAGDGAFTLAMTEPYQRQMQTQIVSQSIEVVRRRIDELGTREPTIQQQGTERILVQVPGLKDPEQLKTHSQHHGEDDVPAGGYERPMSRTRVQGRVPADDELLYEDGPTRTAGRAVSGAAPRDGLGRPAENTPVRASISAPASPWSTSASTRGARPISAMSPRPMSAGRFAIVLDNKVISAPVIREPILGGSGQISGNFTLQTANDLAVLLNAGALPAPLTRDRGAHRGRRARRRLGPGRASSPPSAVSPRSSSS